MDNSFNTSWIGNDKEYADIIGFYDRNMSRSNLLSFIKTNVLEKVSYTYKCVKTKLQVRYWYWSGIGTMFG